MRWVNWLKPPRSLLVLLFLLAAASISSLAWFGSRLLDQESAVQAQHAQERLEQAADRITAALRASLAQTTGLLTRNAALPEWAANQDVALLLTTGRNSVTTATPLLYWPAHTVAPDAASPEAPAAAFAEGEAMEYRQGQPRTAAAWYARLALSKDAGLRAGALLREGRAWRNVGRQDAAKAAYRRLSDVKATVAGAAAELVAGHALCELAPAADCAGTLQRSLGAGRWRLSEGQFRYYWSEAARLGAPAMAPPAQRLIWTKAAELATKPGSARGLVWIEGQPLLAFSSSARVVFVKPEAYLAYAIQNPGIYLAALDSEGRLLAGRKDGLGRPTVRNAVESQLPFTLSFTRVPTISDADLLARKRFLTIGLAVMLAFLAAGTYFIAHAIRRETAVSRLQSEFVAAVSHEFRSPLTSMRQLSEILAEGRLPSEDRRQLYYETLVSETHRLQRLVETLLNFGKMDAGARKYRFQQIDLTPLAHRLVKDLEPQTATSGQTIECQAPAGECLLQADPEALDIALRNLLENALKYSPNRTTVWLDWRVENRSVAIRVRDQGAGILRSERKAIFEKFVRGSAAAAGNVKGTGVGLAIVRHIVQAHGGAIQVASEVGQGSTFTVLLPVREKV